MMKKLRNLNQKVINKKSMKIN